VRLTAKGNIVFAAAGQQEAQLGALRQMPAGGGVLTVYAISTVARTIFGTAIVGDRQLASDAQVNTATATAAKIDQTQDILASGPGLQGEAVILSFRASAAATVDWLAFIDY
jgi:hypothetical protein